jgi:hypothetical protein
LSEVLGSRLPPLSSSILSARTTFVAGAGFEPLATAGVGFGAGFEVDGSGFVPGNAPVGSWAATSKEGKKIDRGKTIMRIINFLFIAVLLEI